MHELAVAKSILEIASSRASEHRGARVMTVRVDVGEFTSVDPQSLEFAFEAIKSEYESCRDCTLDVHLVSANAVCAGNNHIYKPKPDAAYRCSLCGAGIGELTTGNELQVSGCVLQTEE